MTRNVPPERGDEDDVWGAATDDVPDTADVPVQDADRRDGDSRDQDSRDQDSRDQDSRDQDGRDDGDRDDERRDDARQEERRAGSGRSVPEVGSLFDEARRLFGVMRERVVEPLRNDHGDVLDHLSAAGEELLAAYRSAVSRHERRWTSPGARTERVDVDDDPDEDDDEHDGAAGRPAGRARGRGAGRERGEAVPVEEDDDEEPPRR